MVTLLSLNKHTMERLHSTTDLGGRTTQLEGRDPGREGAQNFH
jgi:hypothetical protein